MKKQTVFGLLFAFALCLSGCGKEAASIGIIGGADGPTAIFVTSNGNWLGICGLVGLIVVAILVVLIIRHNKKK